MRARGAAAVLILVLIPTLAGDAVAQEAFDRAVDYGYRVCSEQPGDYDVTLPDRSVVKRATCVSLDAGELAFCSGIAYDACVRYDPPSLQDKRVTSAFDRLTKAQTAMAPLLAGEPICLEIMARYMCALAFPKCDPDPVNTSKYYEIPVCWDYCMDAVFGCMGERATAFDVCNRSVYAGVVASQDRPDVKCLAGSSAALRVVFVAALASVALVFLA